MWGGKRPNSLRFVSICSRDFVELIAAREDIKSYASATRCKLYQLRYTWKSWHTAFRAHYRSRPKQGSRPLIGPSARRLRR